ncbi:arsinothricin resistance N-acetyltransferase ArsN1 family A [Alkaliphilus hydrothermalis]|uniref:Phosphinothricin acetyltransferase n=1 Tax=Alkaliphilus hydrothermalis TaxID=1482730 RepID=A0ABS2NNJ9_9FIRM|nr:arsinothricin resistance N-acetyltransferase ArsN1 family A [Alkaliphilus hydrothermalis]MBM7614402.1 phosphinothricin acetyltransferase [Alkaliphilus hydrothermalis]
MKYNVRLAKKDDLMAIKEIYNEGIEDGIATLETRLRNDEEILTWFRGKSTRHKVLVVEGLKDPHSQGGIVLGWAALNVFNPRACYDGVADFSIYIRRTMRGKGLGKLLLQALIEVAPKENFHKLVLSTFVINEAGQRLYQSLGFREVGTYFKQGRVGDQWIDITIMEKILIQD